MSKVAKNPISIPDNVEVNISDNLVSIKGPLGQLDQHLTGDVKINDCLLYTSPSPRDVEESRMPSSA